MWGEVRKGFLENVASRTAIGTSKCSMNMFKSNSEYINLDAVGCHFGRCCLFVCLFVPKPKEAEGSRRSNQNSQHKCCAFPQHMVMGSKFTELNQTAFPPLTCPHNKVEVFHLR